MNCGSEYYGAYDSAYQALSAYAKEHDGVLIEMYYECEEENDYHCIRFRGTETEEYDRVSAYPPFTRLSIPSEGNPLPVLGFHFASIDGSPDTSILVLLDRQLSEDVLARLEDSVSAYIDSVPAWKFEQLIHDSGQVGYIYASREMIAASFGNTSAESVEKAEKLLTGEVESYDRYLRGECYGYRLFKDGEEIDACWGFFGDMDDAGKELASCIPDDCMELIGRLEEKWTYDTAAEYFNGQPALSAV